MATRRITVEELDDLLVVLEDENFVPGPQDIKLLSFCVQLVRSTLVVPGATDQLDFDDGPEELPAPQGDDW